MLLNPFTPSEIAASPDLFFGRHAELRTADASIKQGSILIQGGVGIGKSSLLAQVRSRAEGFGTTGSGSSVCAVAHRDIKTVDEVARLFLDLLVDIDESTRKFTVKFGPVAEYESGEVTRNFVEGRHLAALLRILRTEYFESLCNPKYLLILAIDEADKAPVPIARFIRAVSTHVQQEHMKNVRFIVAGVNPYFKRMLKEDEGLQRFFYKKVQLQPMPIQEAQELLDAKLKAVVADANSKQVDVRINPDVIGLSVALSGGHPHVLQLLGSHMIDHENESPDGTIDKNDMVEALRVICYEDRGYVYERLLHSIQASGHWDLLKELICNASGCFPTRISRDSIPPEQTQALEWLTDNNILIVVDDQEYGLVDDFLRIRILLDRAGENPRDISNQIVSMGAFRYYPLRESRSVDADYYEEIAWDFAKQQYLYAPENEPED